MTITRFDPKLLVAREVSPPAPGLVATSITELAISVGGKALLTQAGTAFRAGQRVRLVSRAAPANYMEGDVTSYVGSAMVVAVDLIGEGAAGTHSDWDIVAAGVPGTVIGESMIPARTPIVDVYTGQSNAEPTFPDPDAVIPPNLWYWNWNGAAASVGTAFIPCPKFASWAVAAGIRKARANPLRNVYIINIGIGSQPVEQWLPEFAHVGAGYYDMAAALENNVTAALSVLGLTTIDNMHCWMGESNAYEASPESFFKGLWNTLQTRWRGFSWFPYQTPIFCMAYNPFDAAMPQYSRYMEEWTEAEFQTRHFVDTTFLPTPLWDAADPHMSAAGYKAAGAMLYEAQVGLAAKAPATKYIKSDMFVPSVTFDTPGNLAINYSIRNGEYVRIDNLVTYRIFLRAVLGFSTAAGSLKITGLPFVANPGWIGQVRWSGITKAGYSEIAALLIGDTTGLYLYASGSGVASDYVSVANVASGAEIDLAIVGQYTTPEWFK